MDNSGINKSGNKYEDQMKLRKAKLENMRKERELLQREKAQREKSNQKNLEVIRLKKETREKASTINDVEIDKIQQEINALNKDPKASQIKSPQTDQDKTRSTNKTLNFTRSTLQITEIAPIETATFSKHTQTDISRLNIRNVESKPFEYDDRDYPDEDSTPLRLFCNFSSNLPPGILSPGLPKVMDIPPAFTPIDKENPWILNKEKNKKISESQCEEMINSRIFQKSLKSVSLAMEKVLRNNKNIYIDYIGDAYGYMNKNDINSKASLKLSHEFYNEDLTKSRCISCMDWSPHCPDQIAVSYCKNEESIIDTGDDVVIWNQNIKNQTPEYVFQCHSSVTSMCFTKFNSNLILGATYSGQIVLWDNRVKISIPVQCTKLNYKAHTFPIYCLREIDCESSHHIMTISSDGKLCSWNLDMLNQPTDVLQLELNVSEKLKKSISVTCMDFPMNGKNNLILGGEDGCAYSAFRYGFRSGISNRYEKHEAPITSISSHFNQTSTDFGNLFLTSAMDSVIKLWSLEYTNALHTFKNNFDYVMNVAWSPVHPAVFIAADGSGNMDLYNLNDNTAEPITSANINDQIGINRIAWNTNGHHVAAGTENGKLYLYKVAEDLANPSSEEWYSFNEVVHGININYGIEFDE